MNQQRLLDTFIDLVSIDCPSRHEKVVADYCVERLSAIGCDVYLDDTAEMTGSDTGNVIATLEGTAPGKLFVTAHLDCVDPCIGVVPIITDGVIRSSGDTVLGADDKVGVASAIEALSSLAESNRPHPTVVAIFTVQEEVGLEGAKALDPSLFAGELCLVLDGDDVPGTIVIGAPSHYTFKAHFKGRASHAGVFPEQGISAIEMAAAAVSTMKLGRLDAVTTANIGTIKGGTADNVVAGECMVTGECRSLHAERVNEVKEAMDVALNTAAETRGGAVDIDWLFEYEGFLFDENDELVKLIERAAFDAGLKPHTAVSGGGSDANILSSKGVRPVVLGTGMRDFHSTHENIAVRDIEETTRLALAVAYRLVEES